MEEFIALMQSICPLDDEEIIFIRENITVKHYKKREMILSEGEIANKFFFNAKGFVRLFYISDGEEKTAFFYSKDMFVSDFDSYVNLKPSEVNLQAMEDTTLVVISKEEAEYGLSKLKNMNILAIRFMEMEMILHQKLIKSILTESPEKRYLKLLNESPEIIQKVPSRHIASYLRITPESLSRLKQKILK